MAIPAQTTTSTALPISRTRLIGREAERAAVRASWDKWDVIHTIVVLAIVVGVYVVFW